MLIDVGFILLCPSLIFVAVQASLRSPTKLTDDQWLLIIDAPVSDVRSFRMSFIPSNVFIETDNIESFTERVVDYLGVTFCSYEQRGSYEASCIDRKSTRLNSSHLGI